MRTGRPARVSCAARVIACSLLKDPAIFASDDSTAWMAGAVSTLLSCTRATSQTGACPASAAGCVRRQRPPALLKASVVSAPHRGAPVELKAMLTAHEDAS